MQYLLLLLFIKVNPHQFNYFYLNRMIVIGHLKELGYSYELINKLSNYHPHLELYVFHLDNYLSFLKK